MSPTCKCLILRGAVGFLITMLSPGCGYDADLKDCTILCSIDTGCPGNLACGAEGLCRPPEVSTACVLPSDGTGGTITHVRGQTLHTFNPAQSGATFAPPVDLPTVEVLVVGGGGGGGTQRGGGGGGGGGVLHLPTFAVNTSYVVLVGNGGDPASRGASSAFGPLVAIGGGAGLSGTPIDGGSGGGASHNSGTHGTGTTGQGHDGGATGYDSGSLVFTGAGGGGGDGRGSTGTPQAGGAGGPGLAIAISGELIYYGSGGGGGCQDLGSHALSPGRGGEGGGEGGLNAVGSNGANGTGGGGGGGGGGPDPTFFRGGRGGDGVVIVSYPTVR